jgi:hypothetical protein
MARHTPKIDLTEPAVPQPEAKEERPAMIFSGDESLELWDGINATKNKRKTWEALYSLGCHCQELESVVRGLERSLRDRNPSAGDGGEEGL